MWEHRTQQIILRQNGRGWCKLTQLVPAKVCHLRTGLNKAAQEIMQTRIWSWNVIKKGIEVSSNTLVLLQFWVVSQHRISLLTPLFAVPYCQVTVHPCDALGINWYTTIYFKLKNVFHLRYCTETSFTLELLYFHTDPCRWGHTYKYSFRHTYQFNPAWDKSSTTQRGYERKGAPLT